VLEIAHCAPQATTRRARASRALLQDTEATTAYATCALAQLETSAATPAIDRLRRALQTVLPRVAAVIDQTTRRIVHHESVPATEKLVSLFEAHTDVIVKDRRTTHYGHKIFLTSGRSGLILDCAIPAGNPADATWAVPLVRRHARRFGVEAEQVSMDGGFASRENLTAIKTRGVTDVCFAKERGLAVADMTRSHWIYDTLRRFRAGIEAGISLLKRVFGLAPTGPAEPHPDAPITRGDVRCARPSHRGVRPVPAATGRPRETPSGRLPRRDGGRRAGRCAPAGPRGVGDRAV